MSLLDGPLLQHPLCFEPFIVNHLMDCLSGHTENFSRLSDRIIDFFFTCAGFHRGQFNSLRSTSQCAVFCLTTVKLSDIVRVAEGEQRMATQSLSTRVRQTCRSVRCALFQRPITKRTPHYETRGTDSQGWDGRRRKESL
jgi:hypothetical protein